MGIAGSYSELREEEVLEVKDLGNLVQQAAETNPEGRGIVAIIDASVSNVRDKYEAAAMDFESDEEVALFKLSSLFAEAKQLLLNGFVGVKVRPPRQPAAACMQKHGLHARGLLARGSVDTMRHMHVVCEMRVCGQCVLGA
jgi:hypothetical protein